MHITRCRAILEECVQEYVGHCLVQWGCCDRAGVRLINGWRNGLSAFGKDQAVEQELQWTWVPFTILVSMI